MSPLSDRPSATTILEHSLSGTGSLDTLIQKRLDEMARVLKGPMLDKLEWRTEAVADRKAIETFIQSNVLAHGGKKESAAKPHSEAVAAHPEIALPEVVTQLLEFIAATARTRLYVKNGNKKKLTLHVTAWGVRGE